ncbi:hypothetical protein V8C42DRAFT_337207 [Trichoderma barbatum]
MHQPKPQRHSLPNINKWNEAIQHWKSQDEPLDNYTAQNLWSLLKVCWKQFNTIELSILSANEFSKTAIEIAKNENVTNKEEFKKIFKEEIMSRQAELDESLNEAWHQTISHKNIFPCEDASKKVAAACYNRCYMDFIQPLKGIAFGWNSDIVQDTDKPIDVNGDVTQQFVDDGYYGPIGYDHETTGPTQKEKQSQRKGEKQVRFDISPDYNNQGKSRPHVQGEKAAKRLKRKWQEVPTTDPSISFMIHSSEENTEEDTEEDTEEKRPAKRSKHQMPENHTADLSSSTKHAQGEKTAKWSRRQVPQGLLGDSSPHVLSSSDIGEQKPAKRLRYQKSQRHTTDFLNTRASRRNKVPEFWQLDPKGKPTKI